MSRSSLLALGLCGWSAHAQVAPPAPQVEDEREPVVLSPFTATSDQDNGYQAGNTLSGSRFNTKLSETSASVSIFTEEFLKDLGATGLAQVLEYGINANADFNTNSTASSFFFMDDSLLNEVRISNRGLFASKTVDFLETTLPIDTYNTGRMEVSSGPNSVLFGFGAAGGLINTSTRVADLRRNTVRVSGVASSWNGLRGEIDVNVAAVKDRFGLRFMGVHDEGETWRKFASMNTDRWTLVAGFKPFKTTTVTGSYEQGRVTNHVSRPYNRVDSLSYWWRQGHQVADNTSFGSNGAAVQNSLGIRGAGFRNVFVANDGTTIFSRSGNANTIMYESASIYETGMDSGIDARRTESGNLQTLLPAAPRADGLPYAPYDINYYGPDTVRTNDIDRKFFRVEQQLGKDGFLELAYNSELGKGFAHELSGDFALYGDPNQYLPNPDGTATRVANPNAGKLYAEQVWYHNANQTKNEVYRATASWKFDAGKFGEHRLVGLAERSENENRTSQGPEILVNAATNVPLFDAAAPESGTNWLYRRNYVTPGNPETYIPGSRLDSRPINYGGVAYKTRLVKGSAASTKREIDALMIATQSKFFKGRLIVTGGLRHDEVDVTPGLQGRLGASDPRVISGARLLNEFEVVGTDTAIVKNYKFNTYTVGAVVGVTKWLNAFYNESNNNGAPQTVRRILPDASLPTPPEGTGRDWGAMFNFFDGRFFTRATMFETMAKHDPSVRDGTFIGAHRRILNALRNEGYITQAEADTRSLNSYLGDYLSDLKSNGVEVELKANPTKNWTLTAAYSYTKFSRSNLGQEWYPWFAEQKAFYAKFPSNVVTTSNLPISTEVANIETGIEDLFVLNELGYNNRAHKANAFTRYSFDRGLLKGFFVGGGARWQGKNILQRELVGFDANNKDKLGKILYGPEIFNVDALFGYSTNLKQRWLGNATTLRVQLNIANLLDNDDIQVVRYNRVGDGGYWRVVPREPRSFRFSVALGF